LSHDLLTTSGTYNYIAVVSQKGVEPAKARVNVIAGAPVSIIAISGDDQHEVVAKEFAERSRVLIKDAYGNPVTAPKVRFTTPTTTRARNYRTKLLCMQTRRGPQLSVQPRTEKPGSQVISATAGASSAAFRLDESPALPIKAWRKPTWGVAVPKCSQKQGKG
jgi:hypothetical protein